ncbi:MFS transporter [Xanthovirga aplysinae]|uniref:MFS transporter n=1 Tax=Xanthovirga aplysinae TaxID=2529853 RepID=UPI0012BBF308|nr:MFS transporter [Xanthovirga aplysinae]MTI33570.1 MFS transporter [Xanthovirga aplysinae]
MKTGTTIEKWEVETEFFWKRKGKKIANRNLWVSIFALFLAFSTWSMWSVIIVRMQTLGFTFGIDDPGEINALLYSLPAIAGLAGATLRIPNSFLIAIGGGRNVIFISTALILIPAIGVGLALQDINTPYMTFAFLALLSGFGGGNFASSMSNISGFFPKNEQGTALGLNAGLGNLGVSGGQFLMPAVMGFALFGALGGGGKVAVNGFEGQIIFIQNAAFLWVPLLLVAVVAVYFGMNNLKVSSPALKSNFKGILRTLFLICLGLLASALGVYLLAGLKWNMWVVLPITIITTLLLMKYLSPKEIKGSLEQQFSIFNSKHNWIMTIIYTMTFGSFIGFSAAFPKLIQDIFGSLPDGSVNPNAPNALAWAFLGPMVGALVRPIGGWLSDKIKSGSKVTHWATLLQILATLGVAYTIILAKSNATPETYWPAFFALFMILFITTGIGNGSTFRSVPYIFNKKQTGPVLGWISAIAAYGAFIVPNVFGQQIKMGHPEYALYGFAVYYVICLILNWWYYDRKRAAIKC